MLIYLRYIVEKLIIMAVFPNWGAIVANTINSLNNKQNGLVGNYIKERANTKDKIIAFSIMLGCAVFVWIGFILLMWLTN